MSSLIVLLVVGFGVILGILALFGGLILMTRGNADRGGGMDGGQKMLIGCLSAAGVLAVLVCGAGIFAGALLFLKAQRSTQTYMAAYQQEQVTNSLIGDGIASANEAAPFTKPPEYVYDQVAAEATLGHLLDLGWDVRQLERYEELDAILSSTLEESVANVNPLNAGEEFGGHKELAAEAAQDLAEDFFDGLRDRGISYDEFIYVVKQMVKAAQDEEENAGLPDAWIQGAAKWEQARQAMSLLATYSQMYLQQNQATSPGNAPADQRELLRNTMQTAEDGELLISGLQAAALIDAYASSPWSNMMTPVPVNANTSATTGTAF